MKLPFSGMVWMLAMASAAQAQKAVETGTGVVEAESRFLFINMLEFLGEFETSTGEWISPDILADEAFTDLDGAGRQTGHNGSVLSAPPEQDDQ
jgi:hypothetical protein